jgi:hypothetical protein
LIRASETLLSLKPVDDSVDPQYPIPYGPEMVYAVRHIPAAALQPGKDSGGGPLAETDDREMLTPRVRAVLAWMWHPGMSGPSITNSYCGGRDGKSEGHSGPYAL